MSQSTSRSIADTEEFPSTEAIAAKLDRLREVDGPRYRRLWTYCRNPMRITGSTRARSDGDRDRPYRQGQEWGLPSRITGTQCGSDAMGAVPLDDLSRKEVVIENDIGWRMDAMIDYLFGQSIVIQSSANDPQRRELIGDLLRQVLAHNGGILFLQQLALLGTVYGFVDVLVKFCADDCASISATPSHTTACGTQELGEPPAGSSGREPGGVTPSEGSAGRGGVSERAGTAPEKDSRAAGETGAASVLDDSRTWTASDNSPRAAFERLARMVRLEIVEPARALPFLSASDYREVIAYGQVHCAAGTDASCETASDRRSWLDRLLRRVSPMSTARRRDGAPTTIDLITANFWRRYEDGKVVAQGNNSLGRVPVVHIQNTAVPFSYSGASEVEPLIPLQDELNTRLSDRANRITMQSFKMYLGKAIENFDKLPVAPGRMWVSDDPAASVIEFGGDASSPSEDAHLADIRDAIDKTSGVTPIAAGVIKDKIGNLTSAAALRVTLQALIAKTEKRRTCYGMAIGQMCELALAWLDRAGLFATTPEERQIQINWPDPLPNNEMEKLTEAEVKLKLGVSQEAVLRELGY